MVFFECFDTNKKTRDLKSLVFEAVPLFYTVIVLLMIVCLNCWLILSMFCSELKFNFVN